MNFAEVAVSASLAILLLAASFSPVVLVWMGMLLLSPPGLTGLTEEQSQKVAKLRRGFARLIFRGLIWFSALLPILFLIWLLTYTQVVAPIPSGVLFALLFGLWWSYVVIGSLAHAWIILSILEKDSSQ